MQLHERFSTKQPDWHGWVFEHLISHGARLLELGCGPGTLWQKNLASIPPTGRSRSPISRRHGSGSPAKSRAESQQLLVPGSKRASHSFADDTFDGIIANHMLYHVPIEHRLSQRYAACYSSQGRFYAATGEKNTCKKLIY